jgi:hypothetical protein
MATGFPLNAKRARRALTPALAALCLAAPSALAQGGNPDYTSVIRRVRPAVPGVGFRLVDHGNRMRVLDRHDHEVTIFGYEREPYARVLKSEIVQVNERSPADYLNRNRRDDVVLPPFASALARPRWRTVGHSGTFTWIDQRTHWLPARVPPQVTDPSTRTKVFDYRIPIRIDGRKGTIEGALFWAGVAGPSTSRLIVAGVVMALAGAALVLLSRQRRGHAGGARRGGEPAREAW